MEEEVQVGIEKFKAECERALPGVKLVIPVRPTGAAFLVSFTFKCQRTYGTIHEDDFADWGEAKETPTTLKTAASELIQKLLSEPKTANI